MIQQYDECLEENIFFMHIQSKYADLIDRATEENWIICVPRVESLQNTEPSDTSILEHILVPNIDLPDLHFVTLAKKLVNVQNNVLFVKNESAPMHSVHILFKETFYVDKLKYEVWCIDHPINSKVSMSESKKTLVSVQDCVHLLWMQNQKILEKITVLVDNFLKKHEEFEIQPLQTTEILVQSLYTDCIDKIFDIKDLANRLSINSRLLMNVQLAAETFMQNCLGNRLFFSICTYTSYLDANFNKTVRNLHHLQLKDFNIPQEYHNNISHAKAELGKLNNYYTILGKINCLKCAFNSLANNNKSHIVPLDADSLLQIFTFLILKLNLSNWVANKVYLSKFKFSSINSSDEYSFLLTTLEAAIQFIKSGVLFKNCTPEHETFEAVPNETDSSDNNLFEQVRIGNTSNVSEILQESEKLESLESNLCHPLCSCDKCERLQQVISDSKFSVNSCDGNGRSLLHLSCFYGHPPLVDFLLTKGGYVDSVDFSNATPLHYAASRGYQNCALLLLHTGANINQSDIEGNTALHLACNNGHENCVKALVYFSEYNANIINLNSGNNLGDTPVHLASKWGYMGIVDILLQYGVNILIANKRNKLPKDVAHNRFIKNVLEGAEEQGNYDILSLRKERSEIKTNAAAPQDAFGIKPKCSEQYKKIDVLLKAIENDDLPLTRFYLGIAAAAGNPKMCTSICHPLCACEKCQGDPYNITLESTTFAKIPELVNVNTCNVDGFTPIHVAAKNGHTEILRLLLDAGASVNIKTYNSLQSALHLACMHHKLPVIKELLKCGNCHIDIQDSLGNTPLHYAVNTGSDKIAEILLINGANVDVKNNQGDFPMHSTKQIYKHRNGDVDLCSWELL